MSFAASDHQMTSLPRRHFWRRLCACLIDITIFRIVFTLLLLALSAVLPWDVTLPILKNERCDATTSGPLIAKMEAEWPLQSGETRTNQLCGISWLGSKRYYLFISKVASQQGKTNWVRAISLPVDENGNPIDQNVADRPSSDVLLLIIPLAFAYYSASGRRTLGKRLLSLRIKTIEDSALPLGLAVKREMLKFLPLILLAIFNLASLFIPQPPVPIEQMIQQARDPNLFSASGLFALTGALAPMLFVFTLIWWFYPLFIWRGQTLYDRFCDTKVLKV